MSNRLSQLPVEVLLGAAAPPEARLSQLPLEVLHSATPEAPTVTETVQTYLVMPV